MFAQVIFKLAQKLLTGGAIFDGLRALDWVRWARRLDRVSGGGAG